MMALFLLIGVLFLFVCLLISVLWVRLFVIAIRPCLAKKVRVTVVQFGFKMAESELVAHGSTWNHEIFLVILRSVYTYKLYIHT